MKLRCANNSIRLRLKKSDIEVLRTDKKVTETVSFGPSSPLTYTLVIADSKSITAKNENGKITIILPLSQAKSWMDTDQVSIKASIDYGKNVTLDILIEKDYPCLDRLNEDKTDIFFELADQGEAC